jgi:hypothetical protein
VRPGQQAPLRIFVDAPEGYVTRGESPALRGALISRYAEAVRAMVPLPRELKLRVRVLRHDGTPEARGLAHASVTGSPHKSDAEVDDQGEVLLRGLAFLRGEKLTVSGRDPDGRSTTLEPLILDDESRELVVVVTLPEDPDLTISISGGTGDSFRSRGRPKTVQLGRGSITVTALRRNGLPAPDAKVLLSGPRGGSGRTDEQGRITFDRLPEGSYRLTLREPGLVATTMTVDLVDGEQATAVLREQAGRDGEVLVRDADGRPVAHARIAVRYPWREAHIQMVDGVQLLDLYTDLHGRCRLTDLPAAEVNVTATFGTRRAVGKLGSEGALELTFAR